MAGARRLPGRRAQARAPLGAAAALDARLDQALLATFPASDPIAIGASTATEPPSRPVERRPAAIDVAAVHAQRKRVAEPTP